MFILGARAKWSFTVLACDLVVGHRVRAQILAWVLGEGVGGVFTLVAREYRTWAPCPGIKREHGLILPEQDPTIKRFSGNF